MPDGSATTNETKTGASYLTSLLTRIHAVDLSALSTLPPPSDDPKNEPLGENYKLGGQLTDTAKRLWVIRYDVITAGMDQQKKVAEFKAHLLPDRALGRFKADDPRLIELAALQAEEKRLLRELRIIDRLYRAEVLMALPAIPADAKFTVRDGFQVYWTPPAEQPGLVIEVITGGLHPDMGEDDGLGGLLGAIFGLRPKPQATH